MDERKRIPPVYIEGHLNQPILIEDAEFLLSNTKFYCRRHNKSKDKLTELGVTKTIYETCHSPWACVEDLVRCQNCPPSSKEEFNTALRASVLAMVRQKSRVLNCKDLVGGQYEGELIKTLISSSLLYAYYINKRKAETLKDSVCNIATDFGRFKQVLPNLWVEKELIIFNCQKHGMCVGPTTLLIGTLDNLQGRFSVMFYQMLCDFHNKYPCPYSFILHELFEDLLSVRSQIGENFYSLLKNIEPLILGEIIQDKRTDLGFKGLFESSLKGAIDAYPYFQGTKIYSFIVRRKNLPEKMFNIELSGILKLFGHPCIDVLEGYRKLMEVTNANLQADLPFIKRLKFYFIKIICQGHVRKHKKWPNCTFTPWINPILEKCVMEERWLTKRESMSVSERDWGDIIFNRTFEYQSHPEMTEFIKDTSIAPPLHAWFSNYDPCSFRIKYGQRRPRHDFPLQRTILQYLKSDRDLPERILGLQQQVYDDPMATMDNNVIFLCPKERELKKEGRFFCKQTYNKRIEQVQGEYNIKQHILPLVEEVTMTFSELNLSKRLVDFAKMLREENTEIICLDLSKWNMRFRTVLVNSFAHELDKLFGLVNVYTDAHVFFQRAIMLLNDRHHPAKILESHFPEEGESCTYGQLGGCEGMRQKLWTLITVVIIMVTAHEWGINISQMGQGDNQIILMKWTKTQMDSRDTTRNEFLGALQENFARVGLLLKPTETFYSQQLLEFGKVRFLNGYAVPDGIKKICRCIPDINDGISTFGTCLSTIQTCTESCARSDWTPESAVVISFFETLTFLQRRSVLTLKHGVRKHCAILFWTSILGGIQISSYSHHMIRGLDDRLTDAISMILGLREVDYDLYLEILKIIDLTPRTTVNLDSLFDDIFSLNIKRLPTTENYIRDRVRDTIKNYATNPEVLEFLSPISISKEQLTEILSTLHPRFLPLIHEIRRCSNSGLAEGLFNRFVSVKSITSLSNDDDFTDTGKDFQTRCRETDERAYAMVRNHLKKERYCNYTERALSSGDCSTLIAQELRNESYQFEVLGVTRPVPWEQVTIYDWDQLDVDEQNRSLWIEVSRAFLKKPRQYKVMNGPYSEYLGSNTPKKVKKGRLEVVDQTSTSKALLNLLVMLSWARKLNSRSLENLLLHLVYEKNIKIKDQEVEEMNLDWCPINVGGNIYHRFRCAVEKRGAKNNCLPSFATHCGITTSHMGPISKGGDDFNIYFQIIFLYINNIFPQMVSSGIFDFPPHLGATFECSTCTIQLKAEPFLLNFSVANYPIPVDLKFEPVLLQHPTLTDHEIMEQLSFHVGMNLGRELEAKVLPRCQSTLSIYAVERQGSGGLNVFDFRGCDIITLIAGMIRSSADVKKLFSCSVAGGSFSLEAHTLYTTLAALVLTSNRFPEFAIFAGLHIRSHAQAINIHAAADFLHRCLAAICVRFEREIITKFWMYKSPEELEEVSLSRVNWYLSKISKYIVRDTTHRMMGHKSSEKYLQLVTVKNISRLIKDIKNDQGLTWSEKLLELDKVLKGSIFSKFVFFPRDLIREDVVVARWRDRHDQIEKILSSLWKFRQVTREECASPEFSLIALGVCAKPLILGQSKYNVPLDLLFLAKDIHHLSRQLGKIASAASKMAYLLAYGEKCNLIPTHANNVVTLAEGSGSIALLLAHLFKNCNLWFNTLRDQSDSAQIEISSSGPSSFRDLRCECIKNCTLFYALCEGETDITKKTFLKKLEDLFIQEGVSLLTMDAQSLTHDDNWTHLENIVNLVPYNKCPRCLYIVKVFSSDVLYKFLPVARCIGLEVHAVKPICSNQYNQEIYIMFRKSPVFSFTPRPDVGKSLIQPHLDEYVDELIMSGSYLSRNTLNSLPCMDLIKIDCDQYQGVITYPLICWATLKKLAGYCSTFSWEAQRTSFWADTEYQRNLQGKKHNQRFYLCVFFAIYRLLKLVPNLRGKTLVQELVHWRHTKINHASSFRPGPDKKLKYISLSFETTCSREESVFVIIEPIYKTLLKAISLVCSDLKLVGNGPSNERGSTKDPALRTMYNLIKEIVSKYRI
ncbi:RNA-dependent RNA polymerase [Odonatan anphe-related virus OKIAV59]|uniref:RNA-directed RNA polymerase L n=1 Tax=Odonatan anphe-related virus OKIAV59 TaxID=2746375 RepID=A0AAE7II87_9MONO|nr:RNA-dependent RNA polymerase [Odonatan anphe-related virus OKIAV59]QMP82151.1 RNA-dependent RNA polymerase [Odonatan anphe-related virus OKIAV59]